MGLVYRVRDLETGADVALKTFRAPTPTQLVRLKGEFRSLAEISHPNLLGLYELVVEGDSCFFTMELVEGGVDFTEWVTRNRRHTARKWEGATLSGAPPRKTQSVQPTVSAAGYDPDFVSSESTPREQAFAQAAPLESVQPQAIKNPFESRIDIIRLKNAVFQLAQGVRALHSAGKLHRDLKPSNVLVTRDGRLRILDFGLVDTIASEEHTRDAEHRIIGTLQFMSPEQGWGETLTPASDWYSVGVMLYEALTGNLPFQGTPLQVLYAKRKGPEQRVRDLAGEVPPELDALVMGLLRPAPEERYGAEEVLEWASEIDAPGVFSGQEDSIPPAPDRFVPRPSGPVSTSGLMAVLPFVGREEEMAALSAAVEAVRQGDPAVVQVRGLSGMGKSELVRRWIGLLGGKGDHTALLGRCNPQELIPYKAFDGVVDDIWRELSGLPAEECLALAPDGAEELVRLFPVLSTLPGFQLPAPGVRSDPHETRRRGFAAFRDLLGSLAQRSTVVVWIDDLQWGDQDSLRLLGAILSGPLAPSVCFVLGYRAEDVDNSPVLERLLSVERPLFPRSIVRDVVVGALDEERSRVLLRQFVNLYALEWGDRFESVVAEAGGSPFFLSEFVRAVAAARDAGVDDAPSGLSDLVIQRVVHLETTARSVLELVAVAGRSVERSLLLRAAGLGEEGRPVVRTLTKQYFLRAIEGAAEKTVETYHDRIREALVAHMGPGQRAVRHHQLAHAMLKAGTDDPQALVRHLVGAGHPGQAAAYAIQAAQRASDALAFVQAVELYGTALELNEDPALVARLRRGLAEALANAGRGKDAGSAFEAAAVGVGDNEARDLRARAAHQYLQSGHLADGMRMLGEVLGEVGIRIPRSTTAKLAAVAWNRGRLALRGLGFDVKEPAEVAPEDQRRLDIRFVAANGVSLVDLQLNLLFQAQHLIDALNVGGRRNIVLGLGAEAAFQAALKGARARAKCEQMLATSARLAQESGDVELEAWATLGRGVTAYMFADWAETERACDRAGGLFRNECTGVAWELVSCESYVVTALAHMGRFRELSPRLLAVLDSAQERGDLYADTSLRMGMPSLKWLADDRGEFARDQADDAIERWPAETFHLQHYLHFLAVGHAELYLGDGRAAWSRVESAWSNLERNGYLRLAAPSAELLYLRARAARAAGRGDRDIRQAARALRKRDAASASPYADVLDATLASNPVAAWTSAIDGFERADMALHAAASRFHLHAHNGDVAGCDAALATFEDHGVSDPARFLTMLTLAM